MCMTQKYGPVGNRYPICWWVTVPNAMLGVHM